MIRYLIDSSGLWRILREAPLRAAWAEVISSGTVGSCHPQRIEFRRSARSLDEFDQMSEMFAALYPDVPVPKTAWRWIDTAQYRLLRGGAHRALSVVDLTLCATAAHHDVVLLHDDRDFVRAAGCLPDLRERRIPATPSLGSAPLPAESDGR